VAAYVEKHRPANPIAVLRAYQRLVAAEIARGQALIEHAGPISDSTVAAIAQAMTRHYGRPISASGRKNPELIAGMRIRVGDDVYESSVAGQLAALAAAT
jgi:F-type H+-transporting ATPase subunit delta